MSFWLFKTDPDDFSIDDFAALPKKTTPWTGVRNFQARNFMRAMKRGEEGFFYHSSCAEPAITGIVTVIASAYPDETQFDPASKYHDAKATRDEPRWWNVDLKLKRRLGPVSLQRLRVHPDLPEMRILKRGNRLSITPVEEREWDVVLGMARESGEAPRDHRGSRRT